MTFIFAALRTSIGKSNGIYKNIIPEDLAAHLLTKINKEFPKNNQTIILGNAFGTGGNPSRYAALKAGFDINTDAFTIDSQCSSGLKSIEIGHAYIQSEMANTVICGGLESHSLAPIKSYQSHDFRAENGMVFDTAIFSPNQKGNKPLIDAARNVAIKYGISKQEKQAWTINSHQKALESKTLLKPFIAKFAETDFDQSIKNLAIESFAKANPNEIIDYTNTAHYNDAAAVVYLANGIEHSQKPLAVIKASVSLGFNPDFAPESILSPLEKIMKLGINIDLFEINESFAVTPLLAAKTLNISHEKINVLGGNLAYGHPFGASGTINLIHLIAALKSRNLKYGVVVVPAAGGLATAMLIENFF